MKVSLKNGIKRTVSAFLALLMAFGVLLVCPLNRPTVVKAANADVQKYENEIAALEQKQKEYLNKINALSAEEKATQEYKETLDYLVITVNAKIDAADKLIAELDKEIEKTEQEIVECEANIKQTSEKLVERLRANHEAGNSDYFSILIGAEDIGDFLSRMERVNALVRYDKSLKKQYETQKIELEDKKADLLESKELQELTKKSLEADKAESERLASQAENYISSLKSEENKYRKEYEKAKAAEAALDAELEALLKSLAAQNSNPQPATGEYQWPLPWGKGYISCHFGGKDPNGAPHYAVDVAQIGYGCPIYASNSGTVVKAEYHYSYGYYVLIDHGGGKSTLYAHCSSLAVSAGQTVTKGQTISYAGSTGFSTGVHLHFEFRVNGVKQNALNYMAAGC